MRRAGCASSDRPLIFATALACVALSAACAADDGSPHSPAPITRARVLLTGGDTPPADTQPWQPQSLPDDWSRTRPARGGDAWYRVEFDLPAGPIPLTAIYVPRVSMVAAPFVNGTRLAEGGRFTEPMSRLWYRPQLYWVPPSLLKTGTNVLHYRIRCYPDNQGGVSEIYIGDPGPLVERWRAHVFRQVTAMQATTGITAALGVLVLVAWAALGRNSPYGYFGLATMFWTLHATLVLTVDIPIPTVYWEVLIVASLVWVVVALMMFALRFAGLRRPWLEGAAWTYALATPALLWLAGLTRIFSVANALLIVLIAVGIYEFKVLVDVARRSRTVESLLLVGAALFVLGLGISDWLNRQGVPAYSAPFNLHYGVPVLFVTVFWNLLGQAAAGRRAVETLNRDLEAHVRVKTAELERSHAQLRNAYAAEALAAERERIMRDMHDGVGSQLITARQLAGQGPLAAVLDECIDDLRLMIDSLEPADGDLVTVLGNLRYRLTERLARQSVILRWDVTDLPPMERVTPRGILQVLRVVQEAIANVLKHAGATEVVVSAAPSPDGRHVILRVRDNGHGLRDDVALRSGRGLGNMRQRTAALGGTVTIEDASPGCRVTITLPLGVDT